MIPVDMTMVRSRFLRRLMLAGALLCSAGAAARAQVIWSNGDIGLLLGGLSSILPGVTLSITTGADHTFFGDTLANNGTINWSGNGSLISGNGGTLTNNGTFNDQNSGSARVYSSTDQNFSFTNNGTFNKTGTGTTSVEVGFNLASTSSNAISGGTLQLKGGGTMAGSSITVTSGAAVEFDADYAITTGAQLLTVGTGKYNLAGGNLTVTGNVTALNLNLNAGTLKGSQAFAGSTLFWRATDLSVPVTLKTATTTLDAGSTLNLSTSSTHQFSGRTITNSGTTNWSDSGTIYADRNGSFVNAGTFNDQNSSDATTASTDSTLLFSNSGTYNKTGKKDTSFTTAFNNTGTVSVQAGTLSILGGGTSSGSMSVSSGAIVDFDSAAGYTLSSGSALTGDGQYNLNGGTLTINGNVTTNNLELISGTLAGTHVIAHSTVDWSGSDLSSKTAATTTIDTSGTLNFATDGTHFFNNRAIVNNGTINWNDGAVLDAFNNASITNNGGLNDTSKDDSAIYYGGDGLNLTDFIFTNTGTYTKSGKGTTSISIPFFNTGTGNVNIQNGTLALSGGGSNAGTASFNVASGAVVEFDNDFSLAAGSKLTGSGSYFLSGGNLTASGSVSATTLNLTGGGSTLAGSQTFENSTINWGATSLDTANAATTTIASTSVLNIVDDDQHSFAGRKIVNNGTTNWTGSGGIVSSGGGTFVNNGSFFDSGPGGQSMLTGSDSNFIFSNAGVYTQTSKGQTYIGAEFDNTGTVNVENGGTLTLGGGGTNSATFTTDKNTTVDFEASYTLADGSLLAGPGAYTFSSGTLTVTGNVSVSNLQLLGGNMAGSQTFLAGSTVTWQSTDLSASTGSSAFRPRFAGSGITLTALTTTFASGATLNLAGSGDHIFAGRSIVNNGTVNWSDAGPLRSWSGGVLANNGTFNDQNKDDTFIYASYDNNFTFTNNGTYTKTGQGETEVSVPFYNSGTLNVQKGLLLLRGGGETSGSIVTSNPATTEFDSDYTLSAGAALTGGGTATLANGNLTVSGAVTATNLSLDGGQLLGTQNFTNNSVVTWSAANLNSSGTTAISNTSILNITTNNGHEFAGRTINNNGITNWTDSGTLRSGGGGAFNNNGIFNDKNSADANLIANADNNFVFANNGQYNKSGGGATEYDAVFNNPGVVNVQAGTLVLAGGGTSNGSIVTSAGATTEFADTNYALANLSVISGAGTYLLSSGTLTADGTYTPMVLNLSGGALAGTQTWNSATLNWTLANLSTVGTTTIGSNSFFNITGRTEHDFSGRAIVNNGTVNWGDGGLLVADGTSSFTNKGTFNDSANVNAFATSFSSGTFTFTNSGIYNKSGTGTTVMAAPFTNTQALTVSGGTLRFSGTYSQTAGALTLAKNATVQFDNAPTIAGGSVTGSGIISGSIGFGAAMLSPSTPNATTVGTPGLIGITGNLDLISTSLLLMQIGGTAQGTGYDFVSVSGTATLGNAQLQLVFGNSFAGTVKATDTFTILSASSLGGAFSNVANGQRLFTSDNLGSFVVNYGPGSVFGSSSVVLSQFSSVPEPSTWAMIFVGLGAVAWTVRRRK